MSIEQCTPPDRIFGREKETKAEHNQGTKPVLNKIIIIKFYEFAVDKNDAGTILLHCSNRVLFLV